MRTGDVIMNSENRTDSVKDVVKDSWSEIKEVEKNAFVMSRDLFNRLQQIIPFNEPYEEPTPLDMPSLDDLEKAVTEMYQCLDGADCHILTGNCGLSAEGYVSCDYICPTADGNARCNVLFNGISETHYRRDMNILAEDLTWACYRKFGGSHYKYANSLMKAIKSERWNKEE